MTALWILFSSFCSACILASIQCLKETLAFIDVAFVQFMFVLAVTVVVMIVRKVPFTTHVWHLQSPLFAMANTLTGASWRPSSRPSLAFS